MAELVEDVFLRLSPDLVEEVFFRLPPDELAYLFRASAVCKPWRRILADAGFRRRYREFHRIASVQGVFDQCGHFVPTSTPLPAQPHHPDWTPMDCRHGRALFATLNCEETARRGNSNRRPIFDLVVLDPVTGHHRRVPSPRNYLCFSAAVLCAAQGCDHHGCQGGHFLVAFLSTDTFGEATLGWLYSSETGAWNDHASLDHRNLQSAGEHGMTSVLVDNALYFCGECIKKYHLGTLHLSMLEKPVDARERGILMRTEDGGLGFAAVVDVTNLTLWSRDTELEGWAKLRVIDLKTLLPDGALLIPALQFGIRMLSAWVSGFAEGTQVIFVSTRVGSYMVDLEAGLVRRVSDPGRKFFPYTSFYIPAMNAVPIGQGQ